MEDMRYTHAITSELIQELGLQLMMIAFYLLICYLESH